MTENNNNNEIKWVEVEQVGAPAAPAEPAAPVEPVAEPAPDVFGVAASTEKPFEYEVPSKDETPDPFNVEPKITDAYAGETVEQVEAETVNEDPFSFNQQYDNINGGAGAGQAQYGQQPEHGKAVASLVLGIIGICCCGFCGLAAIIFSSQAKKAGNTEGINKAGFVLGVIAVIWWILAAGYNMIQG